MYIHRDGKTNIIGGNCFVTEIIDQVKNKKPNIGLLNPPYPSNKKTDTDELKFVLNNLECLTVGGICIAIVPMQKALITTGEIYEDKKQLLEKHTLEAVLSMPDKLFFNSGVDVVTCVMIFTAHKPHSKSKKTYFGYYKEDGFVIRRHIGRVDCFDKWKEIKEKWVNSFINKETESGFSLLKAVEAEDEWYAEAYMGTDYSTFGYADFEKKIKEYEAFKFLNVLGQPLRQGA